MDITFNYFNLVPGNVIATEIQVLKEDPQPLADSEVFFLHCELLFPAQTRISSDGVAEKIAIAKSNQDAVWDHRSGTWHLKYDGGRSILKAEKAIPVVKAPFGYIPADGHHDIRASIELGATTVPVRVIADLSYLPTDEFWRQAEENGWAYLCAIGGEKADPVARFQDLVDDPNRRFAGIMGRKYYPNGTSKGAEYPLWIKMDRDIPFIEFQIADALWEKGMVYASGEEPSIEFVEEARRILVEAQIKGLKVVPTRIHYSQIQ